MVNQMKSPKGEKDSSGRVCPKCGNDGTRGRIYAVLNDILPADYMYDLIVADCGCSACNFQWQENGVVPRDFPPDYDDE